METRGMAEGMVVRASDGAKLGKVESCADGQFVVETGFLHARRHFVRYDQVAEIRDGDVYLRVRELDAASVGEEDAGGARPIAPTEAAPVWSAPAPGAVGLGGSLGGAGLGTAGAPAGAAMSAGAEAAAGEVPPARRAGEDDRTAAGGGSGREPSEPNT